jgi:hypothetical protein
MASSGSAAQRGPWPPVALQPSAGYDLLWLCSPAWAMASCGSAAQRGLWPLRSRGFLITHDTPQLVGLIWTSDQLVLYLTTHNRQTSRPPVGFEPTIAAAERRTFVQVLWFPAMELYKGYRFYWYASVQTVVVTCMLL